LELTLKEIYGLSKYINKVKAIELDTQIKLAGNKKGNPELQNILMEEAREDAEELDTDESSEQNVKILDKIKGIVND